MEQRSELIRKIESRKARLSYSWLKNFTTPNNFLNYKLKKRSQNKGMMFGSVCDMLLLTPNDFVNRFAVVDKVPTTDQQTKFADEVVIIGMDSDSEKIQEVYRKYYKNGTYDKLYDQLYEYLAAKTNGRDIVDPETLERAKETVARLLAFDDVALLMERKTSAQQKMLWTEQTFPMIAFTDFTTPESIFDLKFDSQCDPLQFERTIYNLSYDIQAGTYIRGAMALELFEDFPQYHFLVYDDKANYFIMELDPAFIQYGMRKLDYYIEALKRCIDQNAWDQSYNFFQRKYVANKPRWAKSFLIDEN